MKKPNTEQIIVSVTLILAIVIIWLIFCFIHFRWINPFYEGYEFLQSLSVNDRATTVLGLFILWGFLIYERINRLSKKARKKETKL